MGELGASIWLELVRVSARIILLNEPEGFLSGGVGTINLARKCARLSYNNIFKSAQRIFMGELRASI